jgi:hypothetical protein
VIDHATVVACPACRSEASDARIAGDRIDRLASAISHARVLRHVHTTRKLGTSATKRGTFATLPDSPDREQLDYRKCPHCGAVCDTSLRALTSMDTTAKIATLRRLLSREISRVPRVTHV